MKAFLYWTVLGFSHAFIFFFGSYFLIGKDTSLLGNGQVKNVLQMLENVNNVEKNVSLNHFLLAQPPNAPASAEFRRMTEWEEPHLHELTPHPKEGTQCDLSREIEHGIP